MQKYVIKDEVKDNKKNTITTYYTGADGYVQLEPKYCDGFQRKGNAIRHIKADASFFVRFYHSEPMKETTNEQGETVYIYTETDRWLHRVSVITIEQ